jgi:hypothetical protein
MITKIISGAQTGVDRAALDFARGNAIEHGGWCPKGRIDENRIIPDFYNLKEISGNFSNDSENYAARTKLNITDSDGTLIIVPKIPIPSNISDGTLLTIEFAIKLERPHLIIGLSDNEEECIEKLTNWISDNNLETLNIAGPRESSSYGIYHATLAFLTNWFALYQTPKVSH